MSGLTQSQWTLYQRIGCAERAANFYITGERKVSARAIAVIINEALEIGENGNG